MARRLKGEKTMKNIEFCAGYYEWAVFVDGEIIHTFDDFSDDYDEEITTAEQVAEIVPDLINTWKIAAYEDGEQFPFSMKECTVLADIMNGAICKHYGVAV